MECKTLEQRQQMKESDIEALQNLLIKNSFRSHDGDGRNMFITAHRLQKIWTESLLTKTFGGFSWATRDFLTIIQADLLKVLSTLVSIGWSDFENFKDIFHDQPGRQDVDLPFEIEHDSFTTSMAQRFRNEQYKFIPITIRENRDEQFSASFRLPFVRESETIADKGSYCVVYKEIVAPRQLVDIDETPNAEVCDYFFTFLSD